MAKDNFQNYDEDAMNELNAMTGNPVERDGEGKVKSIGKVDTSKFSSSGGIDVKDDPGIQAINSMGYLELPFDKLPSQGRFYQDNMHIRIRAARVGEIREFSAIDENSILDVTEKLNYIISQCTQVTFGNTRGSYKDILDMDRIIIILHIRALTFKDGLGTINVPIPARACQTPGCHPQESVPLSTDLFQFKKAEELEKYYDSGKRCYVIQTKNYGIIEISPATIGVANAVMDWGIKQERAQKKWDNSLVSLIPFLVRDWRTLTDDKIFALATEYSGWDTNKFTLIYRLAEMITMGVETELHTTCATCGGEIKFPLSFPDGYKSLFVPTVHDVLGELV